MAVVAVVDDLFFAVRIREAARQGGVAVEVVGTAKFQEVVETHISAGAIEAVILDLNSVTALEAISRLKREARTRSLPLVGFASHVATDVIAAARDAGCDRVLARSAFTKQLPELLRSLSQGTSLSDQGPETRGQGSETGTSIPEKHGSQSLVREP